MDKRYIRLFENFYSDRASLVWDIGSLAYSFREKRNMIEIPQKLWSVCYYEISDCIIDLYRFDLSMESRINKMLNRACDNRNVVNTLLQDDFELKAKVDALYENLGNVSELTYEFTDVDDVPYTEKFPPEEQVKFENNFWKKASPKFKKAHKAYQVLLSMIDNKILKIRSSLVKNKVPISLPHTPENAMLPEEKEFYHQAKAIWDKEEYIDIEENVNYLWVYVQEILADRSQNSFALLKGKLMRLCERYYTEETFFISCCGYIEDLALERGDVKRYLDWSEMQRVYGHSSLESETRVGVAMHENIPLHPMDIVMATGGYYSKFIRDNYALYKVCLYQKFADYDKTDGWFNLLNKLPKDENKYAVQYYLGLRGVVCMSKDLYLFDASAELICKTIIQVCKDSEKSAIDMVTKGSSHEIEYHERLFSYLKGKFPQLKMFLEAKPSFANGEIVPIYIPYRDIVICNAEIQSKCDENEVQRRNIHFVNINSELKGIVEDINSCLD